MFFHAPNKIACFSDTNTILPGYAMETTSNIKRPFFSSAWFSMPKSKITHSNSKQRFLSFKVLTKTTYYLAFETGFTTTDNKKIKCHYFWLQKK